MELWGLARVRSIGGAVYALVMTDGGLQSEQIV